METKKSIKFNPKASSFVPTQAINSTSPKEREDSIVDSNSSSSASSQNFPSSYPPSFSSPSQNASEGDSSSQKKVVVVKRAEKQNKFESHQHENQERNKHSSRSRERLSTNSNSTSPPQGSSIKASTAPTDSNRSFEGPKRKQKNKGGKKNFSNANHLLQFNYKREEEGMPKVYSNSSYSRYSSGSVFKKERYVAANFRFVLSNCENDRGLLDISNKNKVEWENVEQVIIHPTEDISCPICLDAPIVPKVTKCGHIYCWSCILRYLSDIGYARGCPVCSDQVSLFEGEKNLKSVKIEAKTELKLGEKAKFVLLARHIVCLPPFSSFS